MKAPRVHECFLQLSSRSPCRWNYWACDRITLYVAQWWYSKPARQWSCIENDRKCQNRTYVMLRVNGVKADPYVAPQRPLGSVAILSHMYVKSITVLWWCTVCSLNTAEKVMDGLRLSPTGAWVWDISFYIHLSILCYVATPSYARAQKQLFALHYNTIN